MTYTGTAKLLIAALRPTPTVQPIAYCPACRAWHACPHVHQS